MRHLLGDLTSLVVLVLACAAGVYGVTSGACSAASPYPDLAGGGAAPTTRNLNSSGVDGGVDSQLDTSALVSPPAFPSAPARVTTGEAVLSEDEGTLLSPSSRPILDDDGVLGQELLLEAGPDITDAWMPTEGAFLEHVHNRVDQVAGLELSRVRELLGDQEAAYADILVGNGVLADVVEMPTDADMRRLFTPLTRERFTLALRDWHVAAEAAMKAYAYESDTEERKALIEFCELRQDRADAAWALIFTHPDSYAHWALVMRVAKRYFE